MPRVCLLWSFLLANWTSDLSPAFLIRLGFLFSLSYVLSVSVSLCAFASSGFPFPFKKKNLIRVLDMREFEKGALSSIEMPSLHCQKA